MMVILGILIVSGLICGGALYFINSNEYGDLNISILSFVLTVLVLLSAVTGMASIAYYKDTKEMAAINTTIENYKSFGFRLATREEMNSIPENNWIDYFEVVKVNGVNYYFTK